METKYWNFTKVQCFDIFFSSSLIIFINQFISTLLALRYLWRHSWLCCEYISTVSILYLPIQIIVVRKVKKDKNVFENVLFVLFPEEQISGKHFTRNCNKKEHQDFYQPIFRLFRRRGKRLGWRFQQHCWKKRCLY